MDIPQNYTKKKNVFKIKTESETEYWLQAEDQDDLDGWIKILDEQSENSNTLSPQAVHKGIKKLGNLRTRSPTGQSPASKTRKATQLGSYFPILFVEKRDGFNGGGLEWEKEKRKKIKLSRVISRTTRVAEK